MAIAGRAAAELQLRGGVLVHPHGVTLAQSLGETVALVEAPDAAGVSVRNHTGVRTDPWAMRWCLT